MRADLIKLRNPYSKAYLKWLQLFLFRCLLLVFGVIHILATFQLMRLVLASLRNAIWEPSLVGIR